MIFKYSYRIRSLFLFTILTIAFGFIGHATAQERPYLVDLNTRSAASLDTFPGHSIVVKSINDAGQVAGEDFFGGVSLGFIIPPDGGGIMHLNTGLYGVNSINNSGQVVGTDGDGSHAYITGPDGIDLTELNMVSGVPSGSPIAANGINNAGRVVGQVSFAGRSHAFITDPNGVGMKRPGFHGG